MMQKLQNLKDLEYYAAFISSNEIVRKWLEAKPDNKELNLLAKDMVEIFFYVNQLQQNDRLNQSIISEYREEKNKAILKLRKLENG